MRGNCACFAKRKQEMEGVKPQRRQEVIAGNKSQGMREGVTKKYNR